MSYKIIRGPESHAGERHRAGPQRGGEGPLTRPETPHASAPLLNCCWSSFGVTSKRSAVTRKGSYLPTPPSTLSAGDRFFFPDFSQTNLLNIKADVGSQLFPMKPDVQEICENVKNVTLLTESVFILGNIFI